MQQQYHGVVKCALGWACWKTYLGRPETNELRVTAMNLGNGLSTADCYEDALSVREAELARSGALARSRRQHSCHSERSCDARMISSGRYGEGNKRLLRDVYTGRLKLFGEEHEDTLQRSQQLRGAPFDLEAPRRSQVISAQKYYRVAAGLRRGVINTRS